MLIHKLRRRSLIGKKKKDGGFTLIELLVVVTILGILAAVVVFAVSGIGDKGQAAATKTDQTILNTAEQANCAVAQPGPEGPGFLDTPQLVGNGLLSTTNEDDDTIMNPVDAPPAGQCTPNTGINAGAYGGVNTSISSYAIFTPQKTAYPVTVTDCLGNKLTFQGPPTHPMTVDSQAYEMMLWLGLDPIDTAWGPLPASQVPPQFQTLAAADLLRNPLATGSGPTGQYDYYPTVDNITANNPDFVYSAYAAGFGVGNGDFQVNTYFTELPTGNTPSVSSTDGLVTQTGSNAALLPTGDTQNSPTSTPAGGSPLTVPSYAGWGSPQCMNNSATPTQPVVQNTLEGAFRDLRNLGIIFNVQQKAMQVIATMKAQLATTVSQVANYIRNYTVDGVAPAPVNIAGFPSGVASEATAGEFAPFNGDTAMQAVITEAGGTNPFVDATGAPTVTTAQLRAANLQYILVMGNGAYPTGPPTDAPIQGAAGPCAASITALAGVLPNLPASHYICVDYNSVVTTGVRSYYVVDQVARAIGTATS